VDGVVTVALTGADAVASVNMAFTGATRTVSKCLLVDGAALTTLQALPTGSVVVSASAYPTTDCQGAATWIAKDQTVTIKKGQPAAISIVFYPNGMATVTTSYVDDPPSPDAATSSGAVAVAAGAYHTCALLSGGTVACWGDNRSGELGNGTTTNSPTPVAVAGLSGVSAVAVGGPFTWTILSGGGVDVWGYNGYCQFGNGTVTQIQAQPLSISGLTGITAIVAGGNHSCAIVSGTVECWGYNGYGEIGNGTTSDSACVATPATVSLDGPVAVAAGYQHSCALLSNGTVQCWGRNLEDQLGNGTTSTDSPTPTTVSGLGGATAIALGFDHSCALLSNGSVQCWGANNYGQLGNGTGVSGSSVPVAVSSLSGAVAVAAGSSHTCALLSDGSIACWGMNTDGELGNGTTTDSATPVAVSGVANARAITAAYGAHTCALLSGGSITCWGGNWLGQLGDGTTTNSPTPVAVKW